jgi:uncharacterized membrane protein
MVDSNLHDPSPTPDELPFVAPCRALRASAPIGWLRRGWSDFLAAPRHALVAGAIVVVLSLMVVVLGWKLGGYWVEIALLSGFVFVAPVLAVVFYAISWQLEQHQPLRWRVCWLLLRNSFGNLMMLALVLLVVFLLWGRSATTVHIFFPTEGRPAFGQMLPFLAIGTVIGSVFALITFCFSAFSIPMLLERRVDAITAVVTSINAVLRNRRAMAVWIVLIIAAVIVGFATAMVGLAVTMPVIGHATWHAYRETIDASAYPVNVVSESPLSDSSH